jgi:hypothetical protein
MTKSQKKKLKRKVMRKLKRNKLKKNKLRKNRPKKNRLKKRTKKLKTRKKKRILQISMAVHAMRNSLSPLRSPYISLLSAPRWTPQIRDRSGARN